RSEEELSLIGLAHLSGAKAPRVLIGGLGMAFTLRAALDACAADARVTVAELNPVVLDWCRGPLAPLTNNAVADPRVTVALDDVARVIATTKPAAFDAILLDLYEGPNAPAQVRDDPFYGPTALARTHAALAPGGVFGVWAEDPDAAFAKRMASRFTVTTHRIGEGGRRHIVYLGRR
ncbi:MAG: spermidine synthase, partial [Deltaproteobacteria bacterium]|nr:spermidine synthase [Deltaproteobacteria bacterium]